MEYIRGVVDAKGQTVRSVETEVVVSGAESIHSSWVFRHHLGVHEGEGCVQALGPGIRVPGPGRRGGMAQRQIQIVHLAESTEHDAERAKKR